MERKQPGETWVLIDLVDFGPELSRTRKASIEKGLDELAESMKRDGQLQAVCLYKKDSRFGVIDGQRRIMAAKRLGWKEIKATFTDPPEDSIEGLKKSIIANELREDLIRPDLIDGVERLFTKYMSTKIVAEELHMDEDEVKDLLGIIRLEKDSPKVAEEVKRRKMDDPRGKWITYGRIAVEASLQPDGSVDEEKALAILPETKSLSSQQRKRLVEFGKSNPSASIEELLEEARKPPKIVTRKFDLPSDLVQRLEKAMEAEDKDEDTLVELALTEWLSRRGY